MKILFYFLALHIRNSLSTKLLKRELKDYDLAVCNDGSTAAYFYDQVRTISLSLYVYKLSFVTKLQSLPPLTIFIDTKWSQIKYFKHNYKII